MPMTRRFRCWRPGNGKTKTGRLWTYVRDDRPAGDPARAGGMVCLLARSPRASIRTDIWRHSRGTLQADAYAGFHHLYDSGQIQEAACWAHVRRKFYDLQQAHASPLASEALQRIAQLYAIESEIRGRPPEERRVVCQSVRSQSRLRNPARFAAAWQACHTVLSEVGWSSPRCPGELGNR